MHCFLENNRDKETLREEKRVKGWGGKRDNQDGKSDGERASK